MIIHGKIHHRNQNYCWKFLFLVNPGILKYFTYELVQFDFHFFFIFRIFFGKLAPEIVDTLFLNTSRDFQHSHEPRANNSNLGAKNYHPPKKLDLIYVSRREGRNHGTRTRGKSSQSKVNRTILIRSNRQKSNRATNSIW